MPGARKIVVNVQANALWNNGTLGLTVLRSSHSIHDTATVISPRRFEKVHFIVSAHLYKYMYLDWKPQTLLAIMEIYEHKITIWNYH